MGTRDPHHTIVIFTSELLSSRYQVRWQGSTHESIRQKSATQRMQAIGADHAGDVSDPLDRRVGLSCRLLSDSWSAIPTCYADTRHRVDYPHCTILRGSRPADTPCS